MSLSSDSRPFIFALALATSTLLACADDPASGTPTGAGGGGGGGTQPEPPHDSGTPPDDTDASVDPGGAGGGGGGGGGSVDPDPDPDPDPEPPSCVDGYRVVWHDEFDGPNIDPTRWEHEVNGSGGGNNELQYYTNRSENSRIEGGVLVLEARKESYTGPDGTREYTSARLRTLNRGDFLYGRMEARIKLPQGRGIWPAFWMLPTDWVYGGWAASGEIDIMELVGHEPAKAHGTLHYGGPWPNNVHTGASYDLQSGVFADAFHTFAVEWEEGEIRWYIDGNHYQTQTDWYSTAAAYPAPFDQRFHILLNVAVGGDWPGAPDGTTSFPQRMEVDWVRVHERCE
jgi:beta-glucanase (GH16 family)